MPQLRYFLLPVAAAGHGGCSALGAASGPAHACTPYPDNLTPPLTLHRPLHAYLPILGRLSKACVPVLAPGYASTPTHRDLAALRNGVARPVFGCATHFSIAGPQYFPIILRFCVIKA